MDSELRKYPARNESPRYAHDEIADQTQASAHDDLPSKPAGRNANSRYDEKALTGYVHVHTFTKGQAGPPPVKVDLNDGA